MATAALALLWAAGLELARPNAVLWAALALGFLLLAVSAVAIHRGLPRPRVGHDVWLAVPVALAHLAVSYAAIPLAEAVVPLVGEQADDLVFDATSAIPTAAVAAIAGLVVAPLEEVFWRGTLQTALGRGRSANATIAVTTAVFVAFHVPSLQLPLMGAALLGGLAWGWLRERTEGLLAPVLAHASWTTMIVLVPPG